MGEKEGDIIYIYYDRWRERERKLNNTKFVTINILLRTKYEYILVIIFSIICISYVLLFTKYIISR